MRISCILLAAGLGRRFGGETSKLLQIYRNKPIIAHSLTQLLQLKRQSAEVGEIIIVTGYQNEAVEKIAQEISSATNEHVKIAYNEHYRNGLYGSLLCGLQACADESTHMLILPADMPLITWQTMDKIIRSAKTAPQAHAYIPIDESDNTRIGNPVLFHKTLVPLLRQFKEASADPQAKERGAIDFINRLNDAEPHKVQKIPLPADSGAFTDIDEKSDLAKLA